MVRKVTIKDVAALAQTSVTTVSLILNHKGQRFSDETIDRVRKAQVKLGYTPDYFAQNMVNKQTRTIAVLVPDINNPFFSEFIQGIEEAAYREDFIPLIYSVGVNNQKVDYYLKELIRRNVDGFILAISGVDFNILAQLSNQQMPYILLDQSEKQHQSDEIMVQDLIGGQIATDYLIQQGHRKIGIILPANSAWNIEQRLLGYRKTLAAHQIEVQEAWVMHTELSKKGGYQVTDQVIASGVTAVFAVNDELAIGLYRGFAERQLSIPENLSIVGYDNVDWCEYVTPKLTTVRQPIFELGQEATRLLLDRIADPKKAIQQRILAVDLIKRDSVRTVLPGK